MHVKNERESEIVRRSEVARMAQSEIGGDFHASINPRSTQFQEEIITSMVKAKTRMGGTMGGADE